VNIAVIPARGGSKRIPKKNIKLFSGKPIIAWSIETANKSGLFDRVIVSTDDDEIKQVSLKYGAECPFVRPANLSDDYATTTAVMAHALQWLNNESYKVSKACCIYPTAPLLQLEDLKSAKQLFDSGLWEFVFSATQLPSQVFRSFKNGASGELEMLFTDYFNIRTQDLPDLYQDAGQFYWGTAEAWLLQKKIFEKHSTIIKIPAWRIRDIDTFDDWDAAEKIFNQING
jgi:pseudaminic acid cytidylyltransferase